MYFSITFTNSYGEKRNTWEDWKLVPSSPPMIEPPEANLNYVDIPGREEGPLDLTEILGHGVTYQNSEGNWTFVLDEKGPKRTALYQELKSFLHGKAMKIEIEEDPQHYYKGRILVDVPRTGKGNNQFSLRYIISPVRYLLNGTKDGV